LVSEILPLTYSGEMSRLLLQDLQNYSSVWREIVVEEATMTSVKCYNTPAPNGIKTIRLGVSFDLDRLNLRSKLE
jgi:hypothetical protein